MTIAGTQSSRTLRPVAERADPTARAADAVLAASADFLRNLPAGLYTRACPEVHGSTIGQHVRHLLDHIAAALAGADGEEIDYDHRARDTVIERDEGAALAEIDRRRHQATAITPEVGAREARVRVMLDHEGGEAALRSTVARELAFATHHAIHHHAMIASIAAASGVPCPATFGRAPATVRHERTGHEHARG